MTPRIDFACEKSPVTAARGMVVTNHPLASAAGVEMLTAGGNAIDAAIASVFVLSVVEPMMVGMLGGGMTHLRLAGGEHIVLDALSTAPAASRPDMFDPTSDTPPRHLEVDGRRNAIGPQAVGVPNSLRGWCDALDRFGTMSLRDVIEPAIQLARRGFRVTPYLSELASDTAQDLAADPLLAQRFLPGGSPIASGEILVQPDVADSLSLVATLGPDALYDGPIGRALLDCMAERGGIIEQADLSAGQTIDRIPLRGNYRGWQIIGPPPPSVSGLHIAQMLTLLEDFDVAGLGFGSADNLHLLAEVLKIAFADRAAYTGDPAFVDVPVEWLMSPEYATQRRDELTMEQARTWISPNWTNESANTTHATVADVNGNVVTTTQTINSLFGARFIIPGTGLVPNNFMYLFDPHPGRVLSIAPGKRVTTSMSPVMALRDGQLRYAMGMPGGVRIFGSVLQALLNLIDHEMTLQEAVEAPRLWTQGGVVEVEGAFDPKEISLLAKRGHEIVEVPNVGGGMNAIEFSADGSMTGAACWRADGSPVGLGGGLARPGVRFRPEVIKNART